MATEYRLSYTAAEIDEKLGKIDNLVATVNGVSPDENGNIEIEISGGNTDQGGLTADQIAALDGMFQIAAYTADATAAYTAFKEVFGLAETTDPDATVTSISATYTGGDVVVGTAVTALTGITVIATYSDGTTANVSEYTLTGTIGDGSNTITVSYGGKTTTFTVVGVAESGGNDAEVSNETTWADGVAYTFNWVENEYVKQDNGAFITYTEWSRTPLLNCVGASRVDFVGANSTFSHYSALYDANKQFVSCFSPSTNGFIDIPDGVSYFAVSCPTGATISFTATPRK